MSDFEVHPIGTTAELKRLREFVKDVDRATYDYSQVRYLLDKLEQWYTQDIEERPV